MTVRKMRSADDVDRFRAALIPVDQAFFESEQRFGVGRLERLVSPATLASYRRGWDAYRQALEDGDPDALESVGPKMVAALAFMTNEAETAGYKPLDVSTWETALPDGRVLVVCRTQAEASAVLRAANKAQGGTSAETTLPPDLAMTIRHQHENRALTVLTMAEVARLLLLAEGKVSGVEWEGTPTHSGRQADEMAAHDFARSGYPLNAPLDAPQPSAVVLPF
jgi:hypothetical protein